MMNLLIFTAPLLLLMIIGILIRARGNPETSGQRYFLFLVWTSIGSLVLILLNWIIPLPWLDFAIVLFPIVPGLIVMMLLHWREWDSLSRQTKILILCAFGILLAATIGQLVIVSLQGAARQLEPIFFGMSLLSVSAFIFIVWKWGKHYPLFLFLITILYLTFFLSFDLGAMSLPSATISGWMNMLGALAYLAIPGMAIPVMGKLTADVLDISSRVDEASPVAMSSIGGRLMLSLILFGYLLYTYRWLSLWDGMDDGIRWLFMVLVSAIAAVSVALVIAMTTTGGRRWAGLIFAILVMGPIYLAGIPIFGSWNVITYHTITEQRAAHIQEAIESHHAETGSYPSSLEDLIPGQLWRIPLPMIMPEQNWCYEAGPDYYRLGAVYREHWSSPYFRVRVYASAGVRDGPWDCDEKLADAVSQSGFYGSAPASVPLPTSAVAVPRVVVEPILQAASFSMGSWSPNGEYLVFGLTEYFMDEVEHVSIDIRFLEAKTGTICQPSQSKWTVRQSDGLRDHSTWLPDGRLLFVTDAGEMLAFTPCMQGVEDLASRYPTKFTHALASDEQSGRVLLNDDEAYWLLDGISLEARRIAGISPESYRPWYDWSPDGGRLAISWMNGPEVEDDTFLYIVDWTSGEVTTSLPIEGASDANLPIVEWLTRDELLLHGSTLTLLDFSSEPPAVTDVLKDIFLLDIEPNEMTSLDTVRTDEGYYLGVQVDHPRNQAGYVYSSKTGQVEVFQQDISKMLFFKEGQWMRLIKWEDEPSYRDEYLLVWMDQSNAKTMLKIEGHVPRAHPQIFPGYLPVSSQLFVSSSQGISLLSLPDGRTVAFWDLSSDADYFSVIASPNGEALIVESTGDGLYYIPIPPP